MEIELFSSSQSRFAPLVFGTCLLLSSCAAADTTPTASSEAAGSLSPAADVIYSCLVEKGWNVTLTWDGGIEASSDTVPTAQLDQFNADTETCTSIVDDRITSMQPDEIARVYDDELLTRDCLAEQGYEVEAPPSEQQYIDSFHGERWSAYAAADIPFADLADDEWRSLNEACPQPAWSLGAR